MKTLGLLGGMSWESTAVYYRLLNQGVSRRLGGLHSAPLRIASVDFAPVAQWQSAGQWAAAAQHLGAPPAMLGEGGAQRGVTVDVVVVRHLLAVQLLGLRETRRIDNDKGRFSLVFMAAPGDESAPVELTHNWDGDDALPSDSRHFGHLAYEVEDIYAMCQHLQDNGVTINRPPRDGYMAFVKTPDGISIELLQQDGRLPPLRDTTDHGEAGRRGAGREARGHRVDARPPVGQAPRHRRHEVHHVAVPLHLAELGHLDRARDADAAQVVAPEVDEDMQVPPAPPPPAASASAERSIGVQRSAPSFAS